MENLLKVIGLNKSYGKNQVVKNLSFEVKKGEILGFLGPNGAGKSTTISMISTLVDMDEGKVLFNDKDISNNEGEFKKSLGLVPQDIAVFSDLSAYNNVKFFCSLYGIKGQKLRDKSKQALEAVGLWERKNDYPDSFSGGMKRRLNIACSIVHSPKLLIMDEPTVGIDPQSRNNILEVIKNLQKQGTTIIYTSHYMEEVDAICSRIIILDKGEIIEQGNKDAIKEKYRAKGLNSLQEIFLNITGKELRD
ncbi:ABC transporter ATP-binding protein [Clostridium tagluense]|uniref:ABC transporter ATP-binding protein n=1 Tax=Clostridium tagluense TaxID=360422 RepID=UPI001CF155B9|nr:ABC transporter ATP-binding protein [Clostridium tagluense]MCB2296235.1 ABC transporter ATP-binding protein [Clostridium tagluense]